MSDEDKKYVAIGDRLKALRMVFYPEEPIKDYAKMLGFAYTQYLNWESGLNRPMPHHAEDICERFGISMDFIYRGKLDALPQKTAKELSERLRESA